MAEIVNNLLTSPQPLILDGGLATELEARGHDLDDALWSARLLAQEPSAIQAVHLDFLRAGADVVITASYQAHFEGFERRGIGRDDAESLFRLSVELGRRAGCEFLETAEWAESDRRPPLVAASLGSYGACRADGSEYRGDYALTADAYRDFHGPRLEALIAAEPDLIAVETVPKPAEARACAKLLEELATTPAWISFSCRDEASTADGSPIEDAVAELSGFSMVHGIGVNCTAPELILPLVQRLRARCGPGDRRLPEFR